ncbi:MAG TPA: cytochrome c [Bryobacteraceae bacterium]|nr:cytochrome c [Bryobacteraceae bacterium]
MAALLALAPALAMAQNAAHGKVLYETRYRCYTCHGYSGQNGPGARLVPMKLSREAFFAFVRHPREPRKGSSPAGQQDRMPAYTAKTLPDADLADIYAHIKALPDSRPAKDIPLLNQIANQK